MAFCTQCGKEISDTAKYCKYCGAMSSYYENLQTQTIAPDETLPSDETTKTGSVNRKKVFVFPVVLVCFFVIALIFFHLELNTLVFNTETGSSSNEESVSTTNETSDNMNDGLNAAKADNESPENEYILVRETIYYPDGTQSTYTYDEMGRETEVIGQCYDSSGELVFSTDIYTYNQNGTIASEEICYDCNESKTTEYWTYEYDDAGNKRKARAEISYVSSNSDDIGSTWIEYEYDENGYPIAWASDDMSEQAMWQEDEEGQEIGRITYKEDGTVEIWIADGYMLDKDECFIPIVDENEETKPVTETVYDDFGNLIEETYYNKDGELLYRVEYEYQEY